MSGRMSGWPACPLRLIQATGMPSAWAGTMSWKWLWAAWSQRRFFPIRSRAAWKWRKARFVRADLLRGDEQVKADREVVQRRGEKVVIHVGKNPEAVARCRDPLQRRVRVGKGLPGRKRFRESARPLRRQRPTQTLRHAQGGRRQDFPVAAIRPRLDGRLDLGVGGESIGGRNSGSIGRRGLLKPPADAALPVDQRPVTVEGEDIVGPAHGATLLLLKDEKPGACPGLFWPRSRREDASDVSRRCLAPRERARSAGSGERSRPHPASRSTAAPPGADPAQARATVRPRLVPRVRRPACTRNGTGASFRERLRNRDRAVGESGVRAGLFRSGGGPRA